MTYLGQLCYISSMRTKNASGGQKRPSFIEAARRAQIIECAIETIAMLGYAQASLAQIAKRAGISKSVITYHFTGEEELIEQVVVFDNQKSTNYLLRNMTIRGEKLSV